MSAEPLREYPDPGDDPAQILHALPEQHRAQFLTEYGEAVELARQPEHYRALRDLLRLWRLHALAVSDPGYEERLATAAQGGPGDVTLEEIIAGRSAR